MKKSILFKLFGFVIFVAVFVSCDINKNDDEPTDKYLVSFEKKGSFLPNTIKDYYTILAASNPGVQPILNEVKYPIDIYTITYNTKFEGKDIIASGLVSVPVSAGSYPVISFQNGTNTLLSEAPSVNSNSQLYLLLESIASTGFIISVPDYLGFGASKSMFHPYLDKESTVQSVTDMLRAVDDLVSNHLQIEKSKDLYITGYSQGGWATMALQKAIETQFSAEFNLKASACGAGPYDMNHVNDYVLAQTSYPMPYYIGYIFNTGIKLGYITVTPADVFKSPYSERILTLYDGTKSGDQINAQLTTITADLYKAEFITGYKTNPKFASVATSLQNNSVPAWKTNIPTRLYHGLDDNYVPASVSQKQFDGFKAQGVSTTLVNYIPIPAAGHNSGALPALIASFSWFIEVNKK
jgi:pimeloyl-ACP methyl ester carboxylesterase